MVDGESNVIDAEYYDQNKDIIQTPVYEPDLDMEDD